MTALQVPGHVSWSAPFVIASIFGGMAFAVAAIHVAVSGRGFRPTLIAAALLTLAIVSHHFTAMAAAEIVPDPRIAVDALSLSPLALSLTIASGAAAVLGISLVAALAGHSRQRLMDASETELARQAALFQTAVMSMSQGLCMFDRDQRVVVANRQYSEIYGLEPDDVKPGTTLREILQARIARGSYSETVAVDFVETGVASFHQEIDQVVCLTDGRVISVVRKPMADGGLVSTHEDITERRRAGPRSRTWHTTTS
jgi:PAS domain-containing protein